MRRAHKLVITSRHIAKDAYRRPARVAALPPPLDAPTGRLLQTGRRPPSAAGKRKCRRGTCSLLAWRVAATPRAFSLARPTRRPRRPRWVGGIAARGTALAAWQLPRVGPWMASIADEGARRGWRARGARHATRPADWRTNLFSARNGRVTSNLPARNAASLINSLTSGQ